MSANNPNRRSVVPAAASNLHVDPCGEALPLHESEIAGEPSSLLDQNHKTISGEERFGLVARLLVLGAARAADAVQAKKSASKRHKRAARKADIMSSEHAIACPIATN